MQNDYLISVLITNYNTLDFIKLSLYALKNLTNNKYKVLINDNGSKDSEIRQLKEIVRENKNIFVNFRKSNYRKPSYAHAEALDILISMVDTKYTVVLDSDSTFLLKDWDEILISELNDKVKIVGTPHIEGRSGLKFTDFPLQFAVLFDTEVYKNLKISCMPKDITNGEDTCWQWRSKFIEHGYSGKVLITRNTRDFKDGFFKNLTCVTEYYTDSAKLIVSHFGRGSLGGIPKYMKRFQFPFVSDFFKRIYGNIEKKRWIAICYRIINSQLGQHIDRDDA